jgi:hypothetical protein
VAAVTCPGQVACELCLRYMAIYSGARAKRWREKHRKRIEGGRGLSQHYSLLCVFVIHTGAVSHAYTSKYFFSVFQGPSHAANVVEHGEPSFSSSESS